jgi:anthranilate synthase/aminodeoxychorismate synthase-like glutamine amidotransferase
VLYLIDNYDSFTYNLVHYLGELGHLPRVVKNDAMSVESLERAKPTGLVLSPGPGRPEESGICLDVVRRFAGVVPILGVCLGHQVIASVFGAKVVSAADIVHGRATDVAHDRAGVFRGLPSPIRAGRYHSLAVARGTLPSELVVSAVAGEGLDGDGEVMGIRHRGLPIEGVQFHPESILTPQGHAILRNFCGTLTAWQTTAA